MTLPGGFSLRCGSAKASPGEKLASAKRMTDEGNKGKN